MKKIIILEDSSKVAYGGGQKGTLEIINILKENFDIYLFDCTKKSIFQDKIKEKDVKKKYLKSYGKIIGGENSSFSIGYKEIMFFPFYLAYNLILLCKFILKYDKNQLLFYTSNKKHLLILYFLKKLTGIKYLFHARTYDNRKSKFYKLILPGLECSEKIICVSEFIKDNINLNNCEVIYNPLNVDNKYLKSHLNKSIEKNDTIIIATLSELLKWKGVDLLIESLNLINTNKNIELHIYGSGLEEEYLKKLSKNNTKVFFKGFRQDIYELMSYKINIIVSASISPESFGRTTIEGCYFGIVPISSNIGAQKELISKIDKSLLFENKDIYGIAKSIEYAIDNYDLLSLKAVSYSNKFNYIDFNYSINNIFKAL